MFIVHSAYPAGTFKADHGGTLCLSCPENSQSLTTASYNCRCRLGYYRAEHESNDLKCTSEYITLLCNCSFRLPAYVQYHSLPCSSLRYTVPSTERTSE